MIIPFAVLFLATSGTPAFDRRSLFQASASFGSFFGFDRSADAADSEQPKPPNNNPLSISQRTLGSSNVQVSSIALGTQRWVSTDYNAPDESACFQLLDVAYEAGVRTIDTAEQYPIPSGLGSPEGQTEVTIGNWMRSRSIDRKTMTIATKITGATNVSPKNIEKDLDGSLKRLQTDYVDCYLLHWPQRYQPQSNWGQSLQYNYAGEYRRQITFEELCVTMDKMIKKGKIRSWGLCNDSAYGLTKCCVTAKQMGLTPPAAFQGDFSLLDRKSCENGVLEAASPFNENVGFMAYNVLAGGMLTGKYMSDINPLQRKQRGRMDTRGWGQTLYRYQSPPAKSAIIEYDRLAKQAGISLGELSVRWAAEREGISTLLLGHSNLEQLRETLTWAAKADQQPLDRDLLWEIDRVHMKNRNPIFANDAVPKEWYGGGAIGEPIP